MKSNKATNTIAVSLNMSQNNTLEAFSDNKNTLQNALNKIFPSDTSFSLSFSMQNNDSNQSFEQFQEQNKRSNKDTNNENIKNVNDFIDEEEIQDDQGYM